VIDFKQNKRVGLLAKIGRGQYSPALVAQARPAEPRLERAQYLKWVRSVFVLWRHFVTDRLDLHKRQDAPGDLLSVDWDQLIDSSGLEGLLDRIAKSIAARNQNYFAGIVKAQPPRVGSQADMIRQFRERNIGLIKSAGHEQIDQINEVLARGNAAGLRHEEISAQIQERIGVSESRANLIARDQTLKYNSSIHTAQAAAAGIEEFTWSTSHDGAVRPYHKDLDGKVFRYDDPPVTNDAGDTNLPGEDYQCRCVPIPKISLFEGIDDESASVQDAAEEPRDERGRWTISGGLAGAKSRLRSARERVTALKESVSSRVAKRTQAHSERVSLAQGRLAEARSKLEQHTQAKSVALSEHAARTEAGKVELVNANQARSVAQKHLRQAEKHLEKIAEKHGLSVASVYAVAHAQTAVVAHSGTPAQHALHEATRARAAEAAKDFTPEDHARVAAYNEALTTSVRAGERVSTAKKEIKSAPQRESKINGRHAEKIARAERSVATHEKIVARRQIADPAAHPTVTRAQRALAIAEKRVVKRAAQAKSAKLAESFNTRGYIRSKQIQKVKATAQARARAKALKRASDLRLRRKPR